MRMLFKIGLDGQFEGNEMIPFARMLLIAAILADSRQGFSELQQHPFIMVTKSMYPDLREKAEIAPWKEMKREAMELAVERIPEDRMWDWWMQVSARASAASLCYILDEDEEGRRAYREVVLGLIDRARPPRGIPDFLQQVPPGTGTLNLILALDIMHDDFSERRRRRAEAKIDRIVRKIRRGWPWNWTTLHAVWSLYKGDLEGFKKHIALYDKFVSDTRTDDGVWCGGPGYAFTRFANRRDSKYFLLDIAELHGAANYYDKSSTSAFYEWLFGYGLTPMNTNWIFGDSTVHGGLPAAGSAPFNIHKFSNLAAAFAAHRYAKVRRQVRHKPRLHTYLYTAEELPEPVSPPSRIFSQAMAVFYEETMTKTSLAGALWSPTRRGWHSHSDVNAVHLCAYGESLIQNTGYPGAKQGRYSFDWDYISHQARANNTITIDRVNHKIGHVTPNGGDYGGPDNEGMLHTKRGAGIAEGFTSDKLDFACADSGKVIPNGHHLRNLIMVHPQDEAPGYFILLDEVRADTPNAEVNLYLHPNSRAVTVEDLAKAQALEEEHARRGTEQHAKGHVLMEIVRPGEHYRWPINGGSRLNREDKAKVDVFLGLKPLEVKLPLGVRAGWSYRWSTLGSTLDATFETGDSGKANIPTVIYPSDPKHPAPEMKRLTGPGYTGIRIETDRGVTDTVLASSPDSGGPMVFDDITANGQSAVFRKDPTGVRFFFVRKGTEFKAGDIGFRSDQPVSIHLKNARGALCSGGAEISFHHPGLAAAVVGGKVADDPQRVKLPAGSHSLELKMK